MLFTGTKNKFYIGQYVKVINNGATYTSYYEWAEAHLTNWIENKLSSTSIQYFVKRINYHNFIKQCGNILYGIENDDGKQYIIDERGISLWSDSIVLTKMKEIENIVKDRYPNKCPICNWASYNYTFLIANVECMNPSCKHYKV